MGQERRERLFVAGGIAPEARAALDGAVAPLRARYPALRWTDPSQWHLTLAFVGSVGEERVEAVDGAVAAAVAGRAPMTVALSGAVGTFGAGVLYAGIDAPPALAELADAVGEELREAGFPVEERAFVPHCTLARAPRGTRLPPGVEEGFAGPRTTWEMARVAVVRSRLAVGGAVHETRSSHDLGTPPT